MVHWKIYTLFLLLTGLSACNKFRDKPLFIFWEKDKVGFIDEDGKIAIPAIYAEADNFSEGLAPVRKDGHFGFINTSGEMMIPAKYDYATPFHDGLALVYRENIPIFINKKNEFQFEAPYRNTVEFNHGFAFVQNNNGKYGIINKSGKLIADTAYFFIQNYSNGLYLFYKAYGKIEKMAQLKEDHFQTITGYSDITQLDEGFLLAHSTDKDNVKKRIVLDSTLHTYTQFSDTNLFVYAATKDRMITMKYKANRAVTSQMTDYNGHLYFQDTASGCPIKSLGFNRFLVSYYPNKDIIIDQFGHKIDSIYRMNYEAFYNGVAILQKGLWEENRLVDTNLKVLGNITPSGDDAWQIAQGFVVTQKFPHLGIADLTGKEIIKPGLDYASTITFRNGLFLATLNNLPLYINRQGKVVWAMKKDTAIRPKDLSGQAWGYFKVSPEPPPKNDYSRHFDYDLPMPLPISPSQKFAAGKIQVIVRTDSSVKYNNRYRGYPVVLANTTDSVTTFNVQDGRLYMVIQAFQNNKWIDIECLPSSWCGNSYGTVELKPNKYWLLTCAQYTGSIKSDLRIRLSSGGQDGFTVYSNIFKGSINPGQLWRRINYTSDNIMDPY